MNVKRRTTEINLDIADVESRFIPSELKNLFEELNADAERLGGAVDWLTLTVAPDTESRLAVLSGDTNVTRPRGVLHISVDTVVVK